MAASIMHRATAIGLSIGGLAILTWWLLAISEGAESYDQFAAVASHPAGIAALILLTWAFFQKLLLGVRHLVMDTGAGFEINRNKTWAIISMLLPVALTAALWLYVLGERS
jgi:succinate dehydrogenase / fumarate reductase cytochrome b subunit